MNPKINIRTAYDDDYESILNIWLQGIENSFDFTVLDISIAKKSFAKLFNKRKGIFNYWVAVDETNDIVGWQSLIKCFSSSDG